MRSPAIGLLIAMSIGTAATSHAHSFPGKAPLLKANLVQAYPECTAPNTTTGGGRPACLATTEVDPACLFGAKGFGLLTAAISKTSIRLKLTLRGLDPGCEGKTLTPAFTVRTTTDDCPDEHCTVVDTELRGGSCTVKRGKCALGASIATGYPAGAGSEMTVVECGVKDGDATAFTCGIMVK
jgi:hypothetical protein